MTLLPRPPLLSHILHAVPRRYRLPQVAPDTSPAPEWSAATRLAVAIEQAREALSHGQRPGAAPKQLFLDALARMIGQALHAQGGDAAFQAMLLRHDTAQVREYASLSAHAARDRRAVHVAVNAVAHPARQQRSAPDAPREPLARLHAVAASSSWLALEQTARQLLNMPEIAADAAIARGLGRLLDHPALGRLQRLEALCADGSVMRYRALWERHGPRSGSDMAAAQGHAARQRGAAVETSAARALEALAQRLDAEEAGAASYRVVTSMRVPASIPASHDRAKTEWDVVLLRQAAGNDAAPVWDILLLVEAKASVEAAITDFPRLLRGLRLLSQAQAHSIYTFETREGPVRLRGASLRGLPKDEAGLADAVLYCCDAAAETAPRLLNSAGRMQLLTAQPSLDFASALAQGLNPDLAELEPVWQQLLESPRWRPVLHQYPTLLRVRERIVNTDDLMAAVVDGAP